MRSQVAPRDFYFIAILKADAGGMGAISVALATRAREHVVCSLLPRTTAGLADKRWLSLPFDPSASPEQKFFWIIAHFAVSMPRKRVRACVRVG